MRSLNQRDNTNSSAYKKEQGRLWPIYQCISRRPVPFRWPGSEGTLKSETAAKLLSVDRWGWVAEKPESGIVPPRQLELPAHK